MNTNQLTKQLRHIKPGIAPRAEWLASSRAELVARVSADTSAREQLSGRERFRMFTWAAEVAASGTGSFFMRSGVATAALALVVMLGGGSYVLAATNGSVPGESLYQLKVAIEDVRLSAARTARQRVVLQVEFASRRLAEASILTNQNGGNLPQVAELVGRFESSITRAADESTAVGDSANTAEIAKLVDDRLSEYVHTLESTRSGGDSAFIARVGKAIATVNRAETKTLEVIAKFSSSNNPDLAGRLDAKIKSTEGALAIAGGAKGGQVAIAKQNLDQAKELTAAGDYATAITLIRLAEDIVFELDIPVSEEQPVDEPVAELPTTSPEKPQGDGANTSVEAQADVSLGLPN